MSLSKPLFNSQQNLNGPNYSAHDTYEFEDFRLDANRLMLYQRSTTIALKPKVIETLVALVERCGEVVSKEELMDRLWADSFVEESNLTQNIYMLRKALGNSADGQPFIENFSRRGYRFNGKLRSLPETHLLLESHTRTQTIVEETFESKSFSWPSTWLIVATAVIIALGSWVYAYKRFVSSGSTAEVVNSPKPPFQNFKFERQTDKGDITSAAVSPDAKFIAFTDKYNAVWLKSKSSGNSVKIMPESALAEAHVVAISPDNNYIYVAHNFKDKKGQILKVALLGGAVQLRIVEDTWSDLSLSPDGKEMSFIRGNNETGVNSLYIAQTDGSGEREVVVNQPGESFGMWDQSTAWSPDGSRIACSGVVVSDGKQIGAIHIFRVTDGKEISLILSDSNWSRIHSIAWLSNNTDLLVIGDDRASQGQIYKYNLPTQEWHRITNDLSNYIHLSVTSDGKTAIAIQEDNTGNLWVLPSVGEAEHAKQITFGRNLLTDVTGISWTPDGKIVYGSNGSGSWEIWKVDADGTNQVQLTQNCGGNDACSQPAVSPDGQSIVFQATSAGVRNIWRMDADGANLKQLTFDGGSYPSFTPDGRFVIYTRQTSPATTLWQIPIVGGTSAQFSKISGTLSASVSPDGRQFAFDYYDNSATQPFQTCVATIEAVTPDKCYGISRSFPRWSQSERAYYYLDHGYAGIWKQPLDGDRQLFLQFPGERTNNFAFSPDGRSLVVARSKPMQDIVALSDE